MAEFWKSPPRRRESLKESCGARFFALNSHHLSKCFHTHPQLKNSKAKTVSDAETRKILMVSGWSGWLEGEKFTA